MKNFSHSFTVQDPIGLHARPIGQIASLVRGCGADVILRAQDREASADSALRMLAMKVKVGESLEVIIRTPGSFGPEELAQKIESLINAG